MDFKKSETLKNLTRAFAAECQDGAKYQYMADEATQNQLSNVSTLLKALATNEMSHAKIFMDLIEKHNHGGVNVVDIEASYQMQCGKFQDLLKIKGDIEKKEAEEIYPAFEKTAKDEGFEDVAKKFEEISKVEKYHSEIFYKLDRLLKNKKLFKSEAKKLWKCINCGYEQLGKEAWDMCPLCEKNQGYVKITFEQ